MLSSDELLTEGWQSRRAAGFVKNERGCKVGSGNQRIGVKKMKKCAKILHKSVASAFSNGSLPHGVVLAFVDPSEAYLVNLKLKLAWPYLYNYKFVLRRAKDMYVLKDTEVAPQQYSLLDTVGEKMSNGMVACEACGYEAVSDAAIQRHYMMAHIENPEPELDGGVEFTPVGLPNVEFTPAFRTVRRAGQNDIIVTREGEQWEMLT